MPYFVIVRFGRVFDMQRYGASLYSPAQTQFSFAHGGENHYAIRVIGFPDIGP